MEMAYAVEKLESHFLVVLLTTSQNPSAEEWTDYEQTLWNLKNRSGGDFTRIRHLMISDGAVPTTSQRRALSALHEGRPSRSALVSNALSNPLVRGVATALSWMNPEFRIFDPSRVDAAVSHLDLPCNLEHVWRHFRNLQERLPAVGTLELIADALGRSRLRHESVVPPSSTRAVRGAVLGIRRAGLPSVGRG